METARVLIAIQARSTSKRFPGKIFESIGNKRVLDHVIEKANSAATHVNRHCKTPMYCRVGLLIPYADKELYKNLKYSDCLIVEGPEDDVLARYIEAQRVTKADYIVRLTSDCPLLLDYVISKHINVCVLEGYDYVSNVEELCRTTADGFDCEILSKEALAWLGDHATGDDREHVTPLLRRARPRELRQAVVMSKLDTSLMKMSLDTPEDLEEIRRYYHNLEQKKDTAQQLFGSDVFWM